MTIYEIYDLLKDHAKFTFENDYCLSAIWKTGDFNLYDYQAGILKISFYIKHPDSPYPGVLTISTVDDGCWQAESNNKEFFTREKCKEVAQALFEEYYGILPTEEQLNQTLQKHGLYGTFTG